eukprot:TRINITY_DN803_c0_g2_i1.p1 TRINITY_DN803_c0_g2~~TRINITY_DN803_c0_g2_i1.p1  ORF type:complete len:414 (+),score=127.51 TRINITY_DN803_c0_g2_i1:58-1242(+)
MASVERLLRIMFPSQDTGVISDVMVQAGDDLRRAAGFLAQLQQDRGLSVTSDDFGRPGLFLHKRAGQWFPTVITGPLRDGYCYPGIEGGRELSVRADALRRTPTEDDVGAEVRSLVLDGVMDRDEAMKLHQRHADVLRLADMFRNKSLRMLVRMLAWGDTVESVAHELTSARIVVPETQFHVKGIYEGKDARGVWWPITVTGKAASPGCYTAAVHDSFTHLRDAFGPTASVWPSVHPANMRRTKMGEVAAAEAAEAAGARRPEPAPVAVPAAARDERPRPQPRDERSPEPRPVAHVEARRSEQAHAEVRRSEQAPAAAPVPPGQLLCPITNDIMSDPYMTRYGHTFEKAVLLEWVKANKTCPLTRQPLLETEVFPNRNLRDLAQAWLAEHGDPC